MSQLAETRLRTPEVARRLGVSGEDVYRLIFEGELSGHPDEQGIVYVTQSSLNDFTQRRRGAGEPGSQ